MGPATTTLESILSLVDARRHEPITVLGIGGCGGAVAKGAEAKLEALKDEYEKLGCHAKRPAPCARCVVPSVLCTKKRCADRLPE
jgi:hypothetical protein